jgi:hypothetical protein
MDREYGRTEHCHVCGRIPSIGFLYVCRQDVPQDELPISEPLDQEEDLKGELEHPSLAAELREVGLSESVIEAATNGLYTDDQLEKLKAQKLALKKAIEDSILNQRINAMAATLVNPLAAGPANTDGACATSLENIVSSL